MTDYEKNEESHVSDPQARGNELIDIIEEAIDDWVADESIPAYREGDYIVTEEDQLTERIFVMISIAMREASE
jgi:hypothetical protein